MVLVILVTICLLGTVSGFYDGFDGFNEYDGQIYSGNRGFNWHDGFNMKRSYHGNSGYHGYGPHKSHTGYHRPNVYSHTGKRGFLFNQIKAINYRFSRLFAARKFNQLGATIFTRDVVFLPYEAAKGIGRKSVVDFFKDLVNVARIHVISEEANYSYNKNFGYQRARYVSYDKNGNELEHGKLLALFRKVGAKIKYYTLILNWTRRRTALSQSGKYGNKHWP